MLLVQSATLVLNFQGLNGIAETLLHPLTIRLQVPPNAVIGT